MWTYLRTIGNTGYPTNLVNCLCTCAVVARFLNYLADLCVSKGTAVQTIQMMVCTTVLDECNMNVLMQIE